MNAVFARGTWYFERKPLVFSIWGAEAGDHKISSIPLWVKFKNLPDYYWTREGLSCVASSIGPPICADKVTSQLNPVQFAKMCVRYTVGDVLPEKIKVAVLDAKSKEPSLTEFAEVEVSYPQRPMVCSGCRSLGHLVGACPVVKRVWVQKKPPVPPENGQQSQSNNMQQGQEGTSAADLKSDPSATVDGPVVVPVVPIQPQASDLIVQVEQVVKNNEEWTTVKSKKSSNSQSKTEASVPSSIPVVNSGNLPIFTALAKSMSRSQLKRVRNSAGKNSPKKK
nr:PREDICTED: uncharacterized protein LOC108204034 [Daucus carota subsp. sativus]